MGNPLLATYPAVGDPVARHGFVLEPPSALGGAMTVQVPHFDASGAHVFEVDRWSARGLTIPAEGDEVLVVVDDLESAWAVSWWPVGGDVALGREHPFDYGIVEALPTKEPTPAKGDRCALKIATGIVLDLVYTGEATYPWTRIGGREIVIAGSSASITRNTGAPDSTGACSYTAPLAMEFGGHFGDSYTRSNNAAPGVDGTLRYIYVNGVQKIAYQINDNATLFGGGQANVPFATLTVAKGQVIQTAYAVALGNLITYGSMFLEVDPLRVG